MKVCLILFMCWLACFLFVLTTRQILLGGWLSVYLYFVYLSFLGVDLGLYKQCISYFFLFESLKLPLHIFKICKENAFAKNLTKGVDC